MGYSKTERSGNWDYACIFVAFLHFHRQIIVMQAALWHIVTIATLMMLRQQSLDLTGRHDRCGLFDRSRGVIVFCACCLIVSKGEAENDLCASIAGRRSLSLALTCKICQQEAGVRVCSILQHFLPLPCGKIARDRIFTDLAWCSCLLLRRSRRFLLAFLIKHYSQLCGAWHRTQ